MTALAVGELAKRSAAKKLPITIPFLHTAFPYLIVREEKYGPTHYLINNKEDLLAALRDTYNDRKENWYCYDEKTDAKLKRLFDVAKEKVAQERLAEEDIELCVLASFLSDRKDYEYESISSMLFETQLKNIPVTPVERDIISLSD